MEASCCGSTWCSRTCRCRIPASRCVRSALADSCACFSHKTRPLPGLPGLPEAGLGALRAWQRRDCQFMLSVHCLAYASPLFSFVSHKKRPTRSHASLARLLLLYPGCMHDCRVVVDWSRQQSRRGGKRLSASRSVCNIEDELASCSLTFCTLGLYSIVRTGLNASLDVSCRVHLP